ncbi:hypothetical protein BU15DRAFT_77787 [Melanogaster broomeanus]|nr:hypothetical protein BU15DRAFT_77787 [Melanogaster broomeanus]
MQSPQTMQRTPITLAHINGLPVELLQLIFRCCLPAGVAYCPELSWMTTTLRLRHVCRTWKDIVEHYAFMWRSLVIDSRQPIQLNIDIMHFWLQKARDNVRLAVLVQLGKCREFELILIQHLIANASRFSSTTFLQVCSGSPTFSDDPPEVPHVNSRASMFQEASRITDVGRVTLEPGYYRTRSYSRREDLGGGRIIKEKGYDSAADISDYFLTRWRCQPFTWEHLVELSLNLHLTPESMDDTLRKIGLCSRLKSFFLDVYLSGDFWWHQPRDDDVRLADLECLSLSLHIKGSSRGRAHACFVNFIGALRCPKLGSLSLRYFEDDSMRRVYNLGSNPEEPAYFDLPALLCLDQVPSPPLRRLFLNNHFRSDDVCTVIGRASELSGLSLLEPTVEEMQAIMRSIVAKDSLTTMSPSFKELALTVIVSTTEQFSDVSLAVMDLEYAGNVYSMDVEFPSLSREALSFAIELPGGTKMMVYLDPSSRLSH